MKKMIDNQWYQYVVTALYYDGSINVEVTEEIGSDFLDAETVTPHIKQLKNGRGIANGFVLGKSIQDAKITIRHFYYEQREN